ncbi:MAG: phosphatase PAP2 family protein, partial [Zoogloea sp.]|nr:phosphatase PAP2 family protein [Zoogloea sp.]
SRIAVGAHWPADVLAGAAIGWLAGALGVKLTSRWTFWQAQTAVRTMAALALGASAALLILDLGYPQARLYRLSLAAWGIGGALAVLMRQRKAST